MNKANVIHLNRLVDEVRRAVKDVPLVGGEPEIVLLRDPGIIGFVLSQERLGKTNVGELTDVASRIGKGSGGIGGLIVHDGNVIVGFLPPVQGLGGPVGR